MRIFLAGGDRKAYRELLSREGVRWVAFSFSRWLGKPGALRREIDSGRKLGTRYLLLGALPRGIEIEPEKYERAYNRFVGHWGHLFEGVERISDETPLTSEQGAVRAIPVWEPGADWSELLESGLRYLGVRGHTPRLPVMLAQARKRGIKVHGFGVGKIQTGSGLRFDSVDSCSWLYSSEAHSTLYVFHKGRFHILTDPDTRKLDLGRFGRYLGKQGADIDGLKKGSRASLVQAAVIAWRDLSAHMEGLPVAKDLTKRKADNKKGPWTIPVQESDRERLLQIRAGIGGKKGGKRKIGDRVGTEVESSEGNPPSVSSQLQNQDSNPPSSTPVEVNPTALRVMTPQNERNMAKQAFRHALSQLPGLTCDNCAMQVGCPRFDGASDCAYQATFDGLSVAEHAENDISGAEVIADVNRMRALRAVTLENRVNGGIPSKETTALLDKAFKQHMSLADARSGGKVKLTVQAPGQGILSRIFGAPPSETLETNPDTIEGQIVPDSSEQG